MSNGQTPTVNLGVVGLAGFGLTTMILQFHNVGWCGVGPVVALAFVFGGLAQLIAGFQEFKCGNYFGYSAFVSWLLITDPTDKAIFVTFVNTAREVGQGWVEYMWPKPGKTAPS